MQHVTIDKLRGSRTDDENRADHEIGVRDRFLDRVARRCERLHLREENIVEFTEPLEVLVDDCDAGPEPDRHLGRFSTDDSAAMNIWLHKEVMRQLAAHGGKVPANLTD